MDNITKYQNHCQPLTSRRTDACLGAGRPPGQIPSSQLPPQGDSLFVKLYPELSAAALKARLGKELALWYELRALNVTGSGRLLLFNAVIDLVCIFGYAQSTAYRLLRAGDGKLWGIDTFGQPRIKIYGLKAVSMYLDTQFVSRPVLVKAEDFKTAKRACLYASFFKPEGSTAKPISRDSIQDVTGIKKRQQRRYDKVAGIKRVANFAFYQDGECLAPLFDLVSGKAQQWQIIRRLGNIYHSKALTGHRGMVKRINGELRQRSFERDEARLLKRFFLSPKALVRSRERHDESFYLVNRNDRLIRGRKEWCLA